MSNYTIGLAGLQNTSLAIDNTSNNIANANTVGYKAGEYIFADQYFQAIDPSDANRVGQGSQRLAVRRPLTYGTLQNSQNPLDMAIGGDGWFRVLTNPEDPSSLMYTRNGQFAVDKNGWIVNQNGMYLTGFQPSSDGKSVSDDIRGLGTVNGKLRMPPDYANGQQTSVSKISAILDSRENAFVKSGNVAFDPTQNTFNSKTTQTIFDSNGTGHTLEVYYRRVTDSNLQITSELDGSGFSYAPGFNKTPNTAGAAATGKVFIQGTSALTVQTKPIATLATGDTGFTGITHGTSITFANPIELLSAVENGSKIFMNGVDTGLTVDGSLDAGRISAIDVAGSATINIPANASLTFYKADLSIKDASGNILSSGMGNAIDLTKKIITLDAGQAVESMEGRRLFIDGIDTGLTVTSTDPLDDKIYLSGALGDSFDPEGVLTFKQTIDMTLLAPDGTKLVVQGTTNKQNSGTILNAVQANLEVYASIDGRFYDYADSASTFSSRPGSADVDTGNGYKTVAKIGLVAGRNIDSLIVDTASGKPVFSTSTTLSTRVNAGSQQSTSIPLIYELDLSDTQLQASSFMVNQSYQNGEPRSELSSVSIDSTGTIVGVYGNGRKIVAGQIALTQFDADEQLIPSGNNAFAPSYRSGTEGDNGVRIGRAGDGSFGEIKSMAVEASTVDLSNELVKLMILQRMYSANSQSIKAFDQTLQDTIRMTG
jgi:flagellar hook protein FlgE